MKQLGLILLLASMGLISQPITSIAQSNDQAICTQELSQGYVPWSSDGSNVWDGTNIANFCQGVTNYSSKKSCFLEQINIGTHWEAAMNNCKPAGISPASQSAATPQETMCRQMLSSGQVAWNVDGSTSWNTGNIDVFCSGVTSFEPMLQCFRSRIQSGMQWDVAMRTCRSAGLGPTQSATVSPSTSLVGNTSATQVQMIKIPGFAYVLTAPGAWVEIAEATGAINGNLSEISRSVDDITLFNEANSTYFRFVISSGAMYVGKDPANLGKSIYSIVATANESRIPGIDRDWSQTAVSTTPTGSINGTNVRMIDYGSGALVALADGRFAGINKSNWQQDQTYAVLEGQRTPDLLPLFDYNTRTVIHIRFNPPQMLVGKEGEVLQAGPAIVSLDTKSVIPGSSAAWDQLPNTTRPTGYESVNSGNVQMVELNSSAFVLSKTGVWFELNKTTEQPVKQLDEQMRDGRDVRLFDRANQTGYTLDLGNYEVRSARVGQPETLYARMVSVSRESKLPGYGSKNWYYEDSIQWSEKSVKLYAGNLRKALNNLPAVDQWGTHSNIYDAPQVSTAGQYWRSTGQLTVKKHPQGMALTRAGRLVTNTSTLTTDSADCGYLIWSEPMFANGKDLSSLDWYHACVLDTHPNGMQAVGEIVAVADSSSVRFFELSNGQSQELTHLKIPTLSGAVGFAFSHLENRFYVISARGSTVEGEGKLFIYRSEIGTSLHNIHNKFEFVSTVENFPMSSQGSSLHIVEENGRERFIVTNHFSSDEQLADVESAVICVGETVTGYERSVNTYRDILVVDELSKVGDAGFGVDVSSEFNFTRDLNISESACIFDRPAFRFGASLAFMGNPAVQSGFLVTAGRLHTISPGVGSIVGNLVSPSGRDSQIKFEYGLRQLGVQ